MQFMDVEGTRDSVNRLERIATDMENLPARRGQSLGPEGAIGPGWAVATTRPATGLDSGGGRAPEMPTGPGAKVDEISPLSSEEASMGLPRSFAETGVFRVLYS